MLFNVLISKQPTMKEKWSIITDEHGHTFFAKDDIHQRICLDKNISNNVKLEAVETGTFMQCFKLPPKVRFVNNNKNMNPMLVSSKNDSTNNDNQIVYLTISKDYTLISYKTNHQILQTFRQMNSYHGCTIVTNDDRIKNEKDVITFEMCDNVARTSDRGSFNDVSFYTVTISFNDAHDKLLVMKTTISDESRIKNIKNRMRQHKTMKNGFRVTTTTARPLTRAYVIDKKYEDDVKEFIKNISNPIIIPVTDEMRQDENKFIDALKPILTENRIRAITTVGVNISMDVSKALRLLYIFGYDTEKKTFKCIKSN